jgi:phage FluMu protein Com
MLLPPFHPAARLGLGRPEQRGIILLKCPLCKLILSDKDLAKIEDYGEKLTITCPRCKNFVITRIAQRQAENKELGPKLSAWVRNRNEEHAEVPEINSKSLDDIQSGIPEYSPREKQLILLQNIERKTDYPGKIVELISRYDFPLA